MKIRGRIFFSILFLSVLSSFSQKNAKVIIDSKTRQPVDYVYVSSADDKRISLLSNKDGRLVLLTDEKINSWTFYKIGYTRLTLSNAALLKTDTVFLFQNAIRLDDITIIAKAIDTIVMDKKFYVDDYLVLPNNDLLLITSKINIKGFEIVYYKKDRGITQRKKIKDENGEHFFSDCFKNFHLITTGFSRQIFFNSDSSFDFLPKYNRARFDSTVALCVLKLDTLLLMKQALPPFTNSKGFVQYSPFLNYVRVSKKKRSVFYSAFYNKQIRLMLNYEIGDYTMISENAGLIGGHPMSAYAIANSERLFFEKIAAPIYAPAFLKKDTVVIFNFQENTISLLNRQGDVLKETALNERQFSVLRDFEVICDNDRQNFYLKTKKADKACLQRINIYTGELGAEIKLEKVFAKNIQVHNGKIYYLVKEKGWDDTCYLYQQN